MRRWFPFGLFVIVAVFGCIVLYLDATAIHLKIGLESLANINIADQALKRFIVDLMNRFTRSSFVNQGVLIFVAASIIVSSLSTVFGLIWGVSSVFWPRLCGVALLFYAIFVTLFPHGMDGFSGLAGSFMGNGTTGLAGNGTYELSAYPIAHDALQQFFWTVWGQLQITFGGSGLRPSHISFEVVAATILGVLAIGAASFMKSRDLRS